MRHQHRRNADVEIHHLPLGKTGGGIEDLVQIRELEFAALDFDDGGCGHGLVRVAGYGPATQNGFQYRWPAF